MLTLPPILIKMLDYVRGLRIDLFDAIYICFFLFQCGARAVIAISHLFACADSLTSTDLSNVSSYYGPGTFCAWLITITYVLYVHEWRTFSGRLRNVLPQPHPEGTSVTLDPSTCIAILYPLISNIYAIPLILRPRADSIDEAELRKLQAKISAAITVAQVSQMLALPCLSWRYIEELAMANDSARKPRISSKGRVRMWNLLWLSGCAVCGSALMSGGGPAKISIVVALVNLICVSILYADRMLQWMGLEGRSREHTTTGPSSGPRRASELAVFGFHFLGVFTLFLFALSVRGFEVEDMRMCLPNDLRFSGLPRSAVKVTELDQMAGLISAVLAVLYSAWRDHFRQDMDGTTYQLPNLERSQADTGS